MNTMARNDGTRSRRTIFHVAPGCSVPTLENWAGNLTPCFTPNKFSRLYYASIYG